MTDLKMKQESSLHKYNIMFIQEYFEHTFNVVIPEDVALYHAKDVYELIKELLQDETPFINSVEGSLDRLFKVYQK